MSIPEKTLYRAAIGQILADAGITRSTIQEMVREVIQEKVQRQFEYVAAEEIRKFSFRSTVTKELEAAVRTTIKRELANVFIRVKIDNLNKEVNE